MTKYHLSQERAHQLKTTSGIRKETITLSTGYQFEHTCYEDQIELNKLSIDLRARHHITTPARPQYSAPPKEKADYWLEVADQWQQALDRIDEQLTRIMCNTRVPKDVVDRLRKERSLVNEELQTAEQIWGCYYTQQ